MERRVQHVGGNRRLAIHHLVLPEHRVRGQEPAGALHLPARRERVRQVAGAH